MLSAYGESVYATNLDKSLMRNVALLLMKIEGDRVEFETNIKEQELKNALPRQLYSQLAQHLSGEIIRSYPWKEEHLIVLLRLIDGDDNYHKILASLLAMFPQSRVLKSKIKAEVHLDDVVKALMARKSTELLDTSGKDFPFCDRERSFRVLTSCLAQRYNAWVKGSRDKGHHPIPFVADGPGSGKSRFLQELSSSYKQFLNESHETENFKEALLKAVFININFGNDTAFCAADSNNMIEDIILSRILYEIQDTYKFFSLFLAHRPHIEFTLSDLISALGQKTTCIVMCFDEVNRVHNFNTIKFRELFAWAGTTSAGTGDVFFVPVLSGTVIGPISEIVTDSMYPPCHIPLPLLSLTSCERILKYKIPDLTIGRELKQIISDVGGHCRAFEFLYNALLTSNNYMNNSWEIISQQVRSEINKRYRLHTPGFTKAIAYSFLSIEVDRHAIVENNVTFRDLEALGLLKLEPRNDFTYYVKVPFIFAWCHICRAKGNSYANLWSQILIGKDIGWQEWETFNQFYVAFRLSLYSCLGYKTISLHEFFRGAIINIPSEVEIIIPSIDKIRLRRITYRYPITEAPSFSVGDCVVNGTGAPFDCFTYVSLNDPDSTKLLLTFQIKTSQLPSLVANNLIDAEYQKVRQAITTHLQGTDFVFVMLCRTDRSFKMDDALPSKMAVVCNPELISFYGDAYYQRLKRI
ncbi:hypothetical protein ROZALSC1DRAFT_26724 [Rozella allomycis CSF55]|uniref:Crinkler (CRN) family protein n=1 Tax=Rozella allomycis (strain CSF55) TaxID=988480 RepID=A0A075AMJ3_ROZAC|nr:hypothetical protein O9G_003063 [Rozella allomycis CSF55]RKP21893.1 hypothetical protein ROZALSC1DRAFT_26724 [Rozella allomycis CSF55]|eukprot:EPZ30828.1 hypothetical protein O9G_003063 [Rozella allomycis CSF55]